MKTSCKQLTNSNSLALLIMALILINSTHQSDSTVRSTPSVLSHKPVFIYENFRETYRAPKILSKSSSQLDLMSISWTGENDWTALGISSHFKLGAQWRHHYISKLNFLPNYFNPKDFEIYSLPESEQIFTVYTHLLGLYPPPFGDSLKSDFVKGSFPAVDSQVTEIIYKNIIGATLPGQTPVFPIKTYHLKSGLFDIYSKCSKIKGISKGNIESNASNIQNIMEKFKDNYYTKWTSITGFPASFYLDWRNLVNICETVVLGYYAGKYSPNTSTNSFDFIAELKKDCENIQAVNLYNIIWQDNNNSVVKYNVSTWLRDWIRKMDNIVNKGTSPKVLLNASSEIDIGAMLKFISLFLMKTVTTAFPAYDKALIIEMFILEGNNEEYYVSIYFGPEIILDSMKYVDFKAAVLDNTYSEETVRGHCMLGKSDKFISMYIIGTILLSLGGIGLVFAIIKQVKMIQLQKIKKKGMNSNDELWKEDGKDSDGDNRSNEDDEEEENNHYYDNDEEIYKR